MATALWHFLVPQSAASMSLAAVLLSTVGFAVRSSSLLPSRMPLPQPAAPRAAAVEMSTRGVVITGGAGGVGYAYADSFMARGHWVVICDVKDPGDAVAALRAKHADGLGRVHGCVCDVSDSASVEALGEFAKEKLGTIHYWINNAGINGGRRPFTSLSTGTVEAVVKVNLIGVLLCTKVALDVLQVSARARPPRCAPCRARPPRCTPCRARPPRCAPCRAHRRVMRRAECGRRAARRAVAATPRFLGGPSRARVPSRRGDPSFF